MNPAYTARQWTVLDGLPSNTINVFTQTSDGYLWLGTNEGLVRFDGNTFTTFNATNTPALASNRIGRLQEGPAGYLWVVTDIGEMTLYHEGRFTRFETILSTSEPWVYVEGDTVWVETASGVWRYVEGRLEPYRQDLIDTQVSAIVRDGDGYLWVGTSSQGLYRLAPAGGVEHFDIGGIQNLLLDQNNTLWAVGEGRSLRIEGARVDTLHRDGHFTLEYVDAEGHVWITSRADGWWRYAASGASTLFPKPGDIAEADRVQEGPEGRQWRIGSTLVRGFRDATLLYQDDDLIFRVRDEVRKYAFDNRGTLWIGTLRQGLFSLQRSFLQTISEAEGLTYRAVYPLLEDRAGQFWVGTFGRGLVRFDEGRQPAMFYPEESGVSTHVLSLYEDKTGTVWVGGIDLTCRMQGDRCRTDGLPAQVHLTTRAMLEDRQGRFWMGGEKGLSVGVGAGEARTWSRVESAEGLPRSWVRSILETRDGSLLFGTNGDGVLRYDENGGFDVLSDSTGLPSNLVRDIYEDSEGLLWIALEDQGLCRLDRRGLPTLAEGDLRCLDSRNGLYQSGLHRIIEDEMGRFWFNTNNGIFWVERAMLNAFMAGKIPSVTSVSYTEAEGMRNREGNGGVQQAGIRASDGKLWFPTQDGVVIIDPREVPLPEAPMVLLEGVQVDDQMRRVNGIIQLSASERDVSFQYTALEYARAEDVRFQYWMKGYDQGWRDGGKQRVASYTNLSPGSYVFHVRAGIGGVWSEAASLEIERMPYFWVTTWFLVILGLVLVAVGGVIYTYRMRRLKAREVELEQIVAERTMQLSEKAAELEKANALKSRFLANISHEFRTPLTLTLGPLDDLLQQRYHVEEAARPHLERARRNGGRLLRLINQLLDLSKLDAGALLLHPRRQDLAQHLRQLAALFDSIAEMQGIQYSTRIPESPLLHVYDADKIEKVVINLLSNAFKFTPSGSKVAVALIGEDDGAARIVVADTGPGINETHLPHLFDRFYQVEGSSTRSHEGSGIGLALVKELVELHEGTIDVESTVGFGTRFTVRLPRLEAVEKAPEGIPSMTFSSGDEANRSLDISGSLRIRPVETLTPPLKPADISEEATVVLVIEDNADMRAYIRTHLENHFTVIEAENGREGVERALEVIPDLVLSDVMMPEMDGLATCMAIKADERTSHIPVVLLTARAHVEYRIEGYESGADAYLPKPFNAQELLVRVRTLVEERRRLRACFAAPAPEAPAQKAEAADVEPLKPALPQREAAFLDKMQGVIDAHLADAQFGVDQLASELLMSRRQLLRKLRALTDETPAVLLRQRRLEQAASLLRTGELSVKEVSYAVGFLSNSSFTRAFRQAYGMSPSAYAQEPVDG